MKINRIFTNNNEYYRDKMPCMDSLAYTVQEFLYTSGWAVQRINCGDMGGYPQILEFDCQMDLRIKLYDFMSTVHYFIDAAYSDFAKATIKEYISDLQQHDASEEHTYDVIEYDYGVFYITNASNELIVSLLWATWIYVRTRNDPYRNASLLYDLIKENYPYGVVELTGNPLFAHADDAVETMIQHIKDKEEEIRLFTEEMELMNKDTKPAEDEDTKLKAENETLKAENEQLKEQLEKVRMQEKGISLGLNQGQAALFGLSLAKTFGFKYSNKKKELAPLLHKIFGWGEAKLAYYLSSPCENEERDELANLFKDLCPSLYATIMNRGELPQ